MIENGFVKLQRDISQRKWFKEQNTLQMYVTLLLRAAFRESEFEGVTLRPGQLITSISKLAEATSQSVQQTKTALKHLKETNDITIQTTSKFSIITLNSLSEEQQDNKPVNTLDNKQGNKHNNNIIRREKEERKEESIKEEGGASPASLPSCENPFSEEELDLTGLKARLVREYGSGLVERYEAKFRAWAAAKHAASVPMYPTIAKWLAEDSVPREKTPSSPKPQCPESKPKSKSSFNTEELRRAVMEQYRRGTICS